MTRIAPPVHVAATSGGLSSLPAERNLRACVVWVPSSEDTNT